MEIALFFNVVVYCLYSGCSQITIGIGKFIEGIADRLLNSVLSKVLYDETDGTNIRGKVNGILNSITNIIYIAGPAIAYPLMRKSNRLVFSIIAIFTLIGLLILGNKSLLSLEKNRKNFSTRKVGFQELYREHFEKYKKNKFVKLITIPSVLFSSVDIFLSVLLNLYFIQSKGFVTEEIIILSIINAVIGIVFQVPSGILTDENKEKSLFFSLIANMIGFLILILQHNHFVLYIGFIIMYLGLIQYTNTIAVRFGDYTSKENRLSEAESYRMIRACAEGLFSIILSKIFDWNEVMCICIVYICVCVGNVLAIFIEKRYNKSKRLIT